jgi:signal transduction histidine kinase
MRRARWVCCATSFVAATLLAACSPQAAVSQHVETGEVAVQWFGDTAWPANPPVVPAALEFEPATLPHIGARDTGFGNGRRAFARIWVRFPAHSHGATARALAWSAYLPSGSHAAVYLDGRLIARTDDTLSNSWNAPVLIPLPPPAGREPGSVAVSFECSVGLLGCGVPSFRLGDLAAVGEYYEWQRFLRIDAPRIGSLAIALVGIFSLLFWMGRRHETVYALFSVASVLWALRTLHYHLPHYPEPVDMFWWLTIVCLPWLVVTVYLFAFRLQGEHRPRMEWALIGAAVVITLCSLPMFSRDAWIFERLAYALQALLSLGVTVLLSVAALRLRTREHGVMAAALWLNFALGIHDFMLQGWDIGMESIFLLPYAALPLFGAFLYAMARRYRRAIVDVETLNASLEARLGARQRELESSYAKLRVYEIENAQIQERQRLMRDMHDGLGSSLMSSLAMVERGNADPELVLRTLREAVDDLKLTIDSLEPIERDLVTLLATLRYRLTPRLEKAGLTVDWGVSDVPQLEWLDAASALQVLRIVQESITNVLKHARAARLRVATQVDGRVTVIVADDGVGFDATRPPATPAGRGLRNLRHRAGMLGGEIEIVSGSSGTEVRLHLPLSRH